MTWVVQAWKKKILGKSLFYKQSVSDSELEAVVFKVVKERAIRIVLEKTKD
jgi:hypothetical protein